MRLLIVGGLSGQIGLATKIAMDRGAKVTHASDIEMGLSILRGGSGADLVLCDVLLDIGSLGGGGTAPFKVNNLGEVVGQSNLVGGATHGFLYEDGTMLDLNSLLDSSGAGWTVVEGDCINDLGQIVGYAYNSGTGQYRGVLLNPEGAPPVPEPLTMATLGIGSVLLVARRRRRS